jgi:hypothetical protein
MLDGHGKNRRAHEPRQARRHRRPLHQGQDEQGGGAEGLNRRRARAEFARNPLAERRPAYHHTHGRILFATQEVVMAKGQMRVPKEKKKPKADKDKPKQVSAYKLAQTGGSSTMSAPGAKKG